MEWEGITTKHIIYRIKQQEWPVIYILTHPDYWSKSFFRALGLQIAARGMRRFKVNKAIIAGKQVLGFSQKFLKRKKA